MKKMIAAVLVLVGVALTGVRFAAAQEADNDKFSFGKVVSVSADQITVKEYDFAKDADVDMTYVVTAETEFGNVNSAKDLVVDDDIVIDYVEKDGKRVITTLVKEEKGAETPTTPMADDAVPADAPAAPAAETAAPAEAAPVQQ